MEKSDSVQAKQIPLNGPQDGFYGEAEYTVDSAIEISAGKTMEFAPGSIIRLHRFARIDVHGSLICKGTAKKQITFTSIHDNPHGHQGKKPAPFDWNGIFCNGNQAQLYMSHTQILYSTAGISIADTLNCVVLLDSIYLSGNGNQDLAFSKRQVLTEPHQPYTYASSGTVPSIAAAQESVNALRATRQSVILEPTWKKVLRITSFIMALSGGGAAIGGDLARQNYEEKFNSIKTNTNLSREEKNQRADAIQQKGRNATTIENIGFALLGIGIAGFGITFIF